MSDSGISTPRAAKEGLHQSRQVWDSAQRAEHQSHHFVLGSNQLLGIQTLEVCSDLIIRIQVGRVRRQVEQLELFILGFDECLDHLRVVNKTTINDQEYWLVSPGRQPLEEHANDLGIYRTVVQHETDFALGAGASVFTF